MANIKQLEVSQVGVETAWGTPVAQTIQLLGIDDSWTISDFTEILGNKEAGSLSPNKSGGAVVASMGKASMKQRVSFDQIGLWLDSLLGAATPSGAGPYTRTYNAPRTSQPTRSFFTLHKSRDGSNGNSLMGAVVSKITVTIEPKKYCEVSVEFLGKHMDEDATDSLTPPSVFWALSKDVTFSIGTYGGSLSALDCKVKKLEFVFDSKSTVDHGVGSVSGCGYNYGDFEVTLMAQIETADSTALAIIQAMDGTSPTLVKRELRVLISDGTYSLQIDMAGLIMESPSLFSYMDNIQTVDLKFSADEDASTNLTSYCDITLINNVASY